MSNEPKTIRVRIAVAVDIHGGWVAGGASDIDDPKGYVLELMPDELPEHVVHFIEATIPLPESVTVEGEVSEP